MLSVGQAVLSLQQKLSGQRSRRAATYSAQVATLEIVRLVVAWLVHAEQHFQQHHSAREEERETG